MCIRDRVGRNTIKRVLRRHGLEPAPARGKRMPWKTFLRTHLGAIAAADFFSVEVLTLTGLVRYVVLIVISSGADSRLSRRHRRTKSSIERESWRSAETGRR